MQEDISLRYALSQHFSFDELKGLCHDAGIDPENVPYAERGKEVFAFCLIEIFRQKGELPSLLNICAKARSNVNWSEFSIETAAPAEWSTWFLPERLFKAINTGGGLVNLGKVGDIEGDLVGRDKIIVNLVQGINDLQTSYEGHVRNFFAHYVGTDANPIPAPIGKPADALQQLNDWLMDASAPLYVLFTAPDGFGKSMVLAHWVLQQQHRAQYYVVFFPISSRYGTNLAIVVFAALAARTAYIFGKKLTRANDAQEYRGMFNDYLQRAPPNGKPVLVVLDGLNEAKDWEVDAALFPNPVPAHLRVVVSARTSKISATDWLNQLGWENDLARTITLSGTNNRFRKPTRVCLSRVGLLLGALAILIGSMIWVIGPPKNGRTWTPPLTCQMSEAVYVTIVAHKECALTIRTRLIDAWDADNDKIRIVPFDSQSPTTQTNDGTARLMVDVSCPTAKPDQISVNYLLGTRQSPEDLYTPTQLTLTDTVEVAALFGKALSSYQLGDYTVTLKLLELMPSGVLTHERLLLIANSRLLIEDYDKAIATYEDILQAPDHTGLSTAYNNLGVARYNQRVWSNQTGVPQTGFNDLERAINQARHDREYELQALALVNLAWFQDLGGDFEGAETSCRTALSLNPKSQMPYICLARHVFLYNASSNNVNNQLPINNIDQWLDKSKQLSLDSPLPYYFRAMANKDIHDQQTTSMAFNNFFQRMHYYPCLRTDRKRIDNAKLVMDTLQ